MINVMGEPTTLDISALLEFAAFNKIDYHDLPHKYYIGEKQMISVTTFIALFKEKFDTPTISEAYANKNGLIQRFVVDDWDWKRERGCSKGGLVHKYCEDYYNNKIFPYPAEDMTRMLGYDNIKPAYDKIIPLFHKFYNDSKENLVSIKTELIVGDEELGIAGCVDKLFYNRKSGLLEIWDWKTNKRMRMKAEFSKNKYKYPIQHLDYCEINTYSLQLSLYKYIIERNTKFKLGKCYLVWLNENNDNYKVFPCFDMKDEIEEMVDYAKKAQWI